VRDISLLGPNRTRNSAASEDQVRVLEDDGFLNRTPLWHYVLAEAAILGNGRRLRPVGDTIVAEILVEVVRCSENSILRAEPRKPTLPSADEGTFTLVDLLRFAGVH
jgi:hypothetical protein